eukprot:TRINITY_DN6789_c0_g1_i17.p1 TRINITY_DN6789_c0_g1~~TRINITY_DN6789_c0_g1_i17.p1  ORF type:complete len:135 (+),score=0.46 TRINITY_DN6789_c0_g1_i17:258-662(+)
MYVCNAKFLNDKMYITAMHIWYIMIFQNIVILIQSFGIACRFLRQVAAVFQYFDEAKLIYFSSSEIGRNLAAVFQQFKNWLLYFCSPKTDVVYLILKFRVIFFCIVSKIIMDVKDKFIVGYRLKSKALNFVNCV